MKMKEKISSLLSLIIVPLSFLLILGNLKGQSHQAVFKKLATHLPEFSTISIKDILQDKHGFIWIASDRGLYRYDAHDFSIFRDNPLDPKALKDNMINVLAEDQEGYLWMGSNSAGLFRYDPVKEEFSRYKHEPSDTGSLIDNQVLSILIDRAGNLWIGTNNGLDYLDVKEDRFTHYRHDPEDSSTLSGTGVRCMVEDWQGKIWIGTDGMGLNCLDPATNKITRFPFSEYEFDDVIDPEIFSMVLDDCGDVWFCSGDGKLNRINPNSDQIVSIPLYSPDEKSPGAYHGWSIQADPKGNFWIGTHERGLIYLNPEKNARSAYRHDITEPVSLSSDIITALFLDNSGLLWIGHDGGGVSQLNTNSNGIEVIPLHLEGGKYPGIRSFLEDSSGKYWIGTWGNGLYRMDPATGSKEEFNSHRSGFYHLMDNKVWDLLESRDKTIWIGTHKGLQRLDPDKKTFKYYGLADGLQHDAIKALAEDHNGHIWIGTFGGLHRLQRNTSEITFIDSFPGNPYLVINDILEDQQNNIWVATNGQGILQINPNNGKILPFYSDREDPTGLTNGVVMSIAENQEGQVWFATLGGGVNVFVPNSGAPELSTFRHWRAYNSALTEENIYKILIGKNNHLWLGTDSGLYDLDPNNSAVRSFPMTENVPKLTVQTRPRKNGALYFGDGKFIYRLHPDSMLLNDFLPPIYITGFSINGREVPIQNTLNDTLKTPSPLSRSILFTNFIELKHWQNNLTFEFAALNFRKPDNNLYQYRLEGYEDHWNMTNPTQRLVRYTNLPPGTYFFKVRGSDSEGQWNLTGKSIQLRIFPPWWFTWWACTLWLGIFFGGLFFIRRYELRLRQVKEQARHLLELDAIKSRFYADITHEFRTPLTNILGMTEHLQSKIEKNLRSSLDIIRRNGRQLLGLVNQMLDLAKLESGETRLKMSQSEVINYLQYLAESFHSLAENKRIRLHFLTGLPALYMDFDPEGLLRIFSNLLSNAVKFTPEGGDIYLFVNQSGKSLEIKVKDTGIGIPKEKLPYVFNRFFQVDAPGDREHARNPKRRHKIDSARTEGTGIGLDLTKKYVELMGGTIGATSELGKGTEFTVLLPITQTAEQRPADLSQRNIQKEDSPPPAPVAQNKDRRSPLLLIVEDNHDVVKYLITCLNTDYRIEVAYNGQQGVDKAVELVPDLIVSDVMMPQKDGYELCHTLKTDQRTSHIPIILLTAKADQDSRMTGLRTGADAYLAKPFLKEELLAHIHNLLEVRRKLHAHYLAQVGLPAGNREPFPIQTSLESAFEHAFIQKLRTLLEADLTRQWPVPELARQLHVSDSQLHRKLEALTGMHATEFVRYVRLTKGSQLLLDRPKEKISAIAYEVGFTSPNEFTRRFGEVFGRTPGEWRRGGA